MPSRARNRFKTTSGKAKLLEALLEPVVWIQTVKGSGDLAIRRNRIAHEALDRTPSLSKVSKAEKGEFIAEAAKWMSPRRIVFLFARVYNLDKTDLYHQWTDPYSKRNYEYEKSKTRGIERRTELDQILKDKISWLKRHMK